MLCSYISIGVMGFLPDFLNENHKRATKTNLYQNFCLLVNKGLSKEKQTQLQVLMSLCHKNQTS